MPTRGENDRLKNALADTGALRSAFATRFPGIDMLALPADWFNPALSSEQTAKSLFNAMNYASSMYRDFYMYRQLASAALVPNARICRGWARPCSIAGASIDVRAR
jgi:hypothetical protein